MLHCIPVEPGGRLHFTVHHTLLPLHHISVSSESSYRGGRRYHFKFLWTTFHRDITFHYITSEFIWRVGQSSYRVGGSWIRRSPAAIRSRGGAKRDTGMCYRSWGWHKYTTYHRALGTTYILYLCSYERSKLSLTHPLTHWDTRTGSEICCCNEKRDTGMSGWHKHTTYHWVLGTTYIPQYVSFKDSM